MKRAAPVGFFLGALAIASSAGAQPGNTGTLPPAEQPAPAPTPAPAPAPSTAPAPTQPPAQPAPAQQPPPGAGPGYQQPPPGYYPPPYGSPYAPPPPPPEERPKRTVSITFSPLHLLIGPIFEGNIELRPTDHIGLAVIGGYGTIGVEDPTGTGTDRFDVLELGGQFLVYPMEPFDRLMVGAELLYVHVASDTLGNQNISGVGVGYAVGPMVGYKLLTNGGFTFVVQGGFEYIFLRAQANDTSGNSASGSDSRFIPLLNLNIGWSF